MEATCRQVVIIVHTTSDIEFEVTEVNTGRTLVDRSFWCEEGDDDAEQQGWDYWDAFAVKRGWEVVGKVWS